MAHNRSMEAIVPLVLEGRFVRLEPLERRHEAALALVAVDEELWRYFTSSLATPDGLRRWIDTALDNAARGTELPFATVELATGTVAGGTRVMDIQYAHDTVEIGATWLGRAWWRTAINSESKYLLLRHLFDTIGCRRVSLKTDLLNTRSQRAIERLGAVREGVLRKHMLVQGGRSRDTVYYSILDDEWPQTRKNMERNLYKG